MTWTAELPKDLRQLEAALRSARFPKASRAARAIEGQRPLLVESGKGRRKKSGPGSESRLWSNHHFSEAGKYRRSRLSLWLDPNDLLRLFLGRRRSHSHYGKALKTLRSGNTSSTVNRPTLI